MTNTTIQVPHSPTAPITAPSTAKNTDSTTGPTIGPTTGRRVWLAGPGFHFLGGLSVYTCRLANALAVDHEVSVVSLRRLLPARFYPGGARVGQDLTSLSYDPAVRIVGQLDWFWGLTMFRVLRAMRRERPDVIVLQWWTAAVLHSYLVLAIAARVLRIPVTIEFHEVQDTGEAGIPLVASYCRLVFPRLLALAGGALVHNQHDHDSLREAYGAAAIDRLHVEIAPHGPYDHLTQRSGRAEPSTTSDVTRLLFFGLIRPYKGLDTLLEAFNALSAERVQDFRLTVVGETWEGWVLPTELIAASPHRDRIDFVNRYVSDDEAAQFFAGADAVVLPYRRGSASGPLQIAISYGLNIVMSDVGGLTEAVTDYDGVTLIAPDDVAGLQAALLELPARRTQRYDDPHSWDATTHAIEKLVAATADSPR